MGPPDPAAAAGAATAASQTAVAAQATGLSSAVNFRAKPVVKAGAVEAGEAV